jgi:hypothetical protein
MRPKGSKNKINAVAEKVKKIENELEINIDELIPDMQNNITVEKVETVADKSVNAEITLTIVKPKTRFDDIRYILLAKDIHRLYAYNMPYEEFEVIMRWWLIKTNVYIENFTRYWLDRFLHELPYLNFKIVEQLLKNEGLL